MASLLSTLRTQQVQLVARVALLLLCVFAFCISVLQTTWIGAPVILFMLVIAVTLSIMRRVEKSNRDFAQFLNNINHNDFASSSGSITQGFGARDFVVAQKSLLSKYKKLKADRSAQYEYLNMVVEHVDTALICFDERGKIEILNRAATQLLGKKYIGNLSTIASLNPTLAQALNDIEAGKSELLKIVVNNELLQLALSATEFILLEKKFKLVSLQNIKNALDEREVESWQKLIKVLTHEIMNSITPIVSLSHYIDGVVNDQENMDALNNKSSEQFIDFQRSVNAIASRGQGLMEFVDSYRSLSNLPEPNFSDTDITKLFQHIETLLRDKLSSANINFKLSISGSSRTLRVDEKQLEQILINLVGNAIDAVESADNPTIELSFTSNEEGKKSIQITDNGCGMEQAVAENVFTPFYTTKELGNGIGLSISRQLARQNHAVLSVKSLVNEGSQFSLLFQSAA